MDAVRRYTQRLGWVLAWHLGLASMLLLALVWALQPPALLASAGLVFVALCALGASLWWRVQHHTRTLTRLVHALRHDELSAHFEPASSAGDDVALADALNALMATLRAQRQSQQVAHLQQQGLLEQVPTPLLRVEVQAPQRVFLLNAAARRFFGTRHDGQPLAAWAGEGPQAQAFLQALSDGAPSQALDWCAPGQPPQRVRLSRSHWVQAGQAQRLVAVQPVQGDIDSARAQLQTDLVRVLSHEVMNSLTPVTSLADSVAAEVGRRIEQGDATAHGLQETTTALARRARGLMSFVQRYRELAQAVVVHPQTLAAQALADECATLFAAQWPHARLELHVQPPGLELQADAQALLPVLLNLLRNAVEAVKAVEAVTLSAGHGAATAAPVAQVQLRFTEAEGGRCVIDVIDNGPGIAPAWRSDVFLPFFTTKAQGGGIGLALARQVVQAHGGRISVREAEGGHLQVLI
jgi:nitrogen fixation/metabolism regulation signal transduction histidine kinase